MGNKPTVLFVSHADSACGVYQYGVNVAGALRKSARYTVEYIECRNADTFVSAVRKHRPAAIIYNYYDCTLPWVSAPLLLKLKVPHIGIMHECTQASANAASSALFDYHIAPDPTLESVNPIVYKSLRLLVNYGREFPVPSIPTIGSFGFGLKGKGFERLIQTVQDEYDNAVIRLQIPFAKFGDADGSLATSTGLQCRKLITKPGIRLELGHEFLSQEQILDFLAQNSVNAFFYDPYEGRGLSSAVDYALAVRRPIAITKSSMFRHLSSGCPSICIENSTLREIISNGTTPLTNFYNQWSEENFLRDYECTLESILSRPLVRTRFKRFRKGARRVIGGIRRLGRICEQLAPAD